MASGVAIFRTRCIRCIALNLTNSYPSSFGAPVTSQIILQQRRANHYRRFGKKLEDSYKNNPKRRAEYEEMGMTGVLKKNRMYAQYNYQEWRFPTQQRPIDVSSSRVVFKEYQDKAGMMSRLRDPRKEIEDKRLEFFSARAIKKRVSDFHRKRFPTQAQEIYIKAHELLNSENWTLPKKEETEETLHGLVTELAYPKMVEGLDKKTVVWKFVESIEPPRTVQIITGPMMHEDNLYGQVTVRFHTKQILTLYDRFGRLMLGSPSEARDILEYVTFERHIVDPYGKWRIHGKNLVENKNQDYYDRTVAIIKKKPERIEAEEWHKQEKEVTTYKWYPARDRIVEKLNRPFTVYRTKKQRGAMRKKWVTTVLHAPLLRMKKRDLRKVSEKSKKVYLMRQTGELPKPPP